MRSFVMSLNRSSDAITSTAASHTPPMSQPSFSEISRIINQCEIFFEKQKCADLKTKVKPILDDANDNITKGHIRANPKEILFEIYACILKHEPNKSTHTKMGREFMGTFHRELMTLTDIEFKKLANELDKCITNKTRLLLIEPESERPEEGLSCYLFLMAYVRYGYKKMKHPLPKPFSLHLLNINWDKNLVLRNQKTEDDKVREKAREEADGKKAREEAHGKSNENNNTREAINIANILEKTKGTVCAQGSWLLTFGNNILLALQEYNSTYLEGWQQSVQKNQNEVLAHEEDEYSEEVDEYLDAENQLDSDDEQFEVDVDDDSLSESFSWAGSGSCVPSSAASSSGESPNESVEQMEHVTTEIPSVSRASTDHRAEDTASSDDAPDMPLARGSQEEPNTTTTTTTTTNISSAGQTQQIKRKLADLEAEADLLAKVQCAEEANRKSQTVRAKLYKQATVREKVLDEELKRLAAKEARLDLKLSLFKQPGMDTGPQSSSVQCEPTNRPSHT